MHFRAEVQTAKFKQLDCSLPTALVCLALFCCCMRLLKRLSKQQTEMLWAPTSAAHKIRGLTAAHCQASHCALSVCRQARQQSSICSHRPAAFALRQIWQESSCVVMCRHSRSTATTIAAQQSQQTDAAAAEDLLIVGALMCLALLHWHRHCQASHKEPSTSWWFDCVRACRPRRPGELHRQVVAGTTSQRGSGRPNQHPQQSCAVQHPAGFRLSTAFLLLYELARHVRALPSYILLPAACLLAPGPQHSLSYSCTGLAGMETEVAMMP